LVTFPVLESGFVQAPTELHTLNELTSTPKHFGVELVVPNHPLLHTHVLAFVQTPAPLHTNELLAIVPKHHSVWQIEPKYSFWHTQVSDCKQAPLQGLKKFCIPWPDGAKANWCLTNRTNVTCLEHASICLGACMSLCCKLVLCCCLKHRNT